MTILILFAAAAAGGALQNAGEKAALVHASTDPPFQVSLPTGYGRVESRGVGASYERTAGRETWERVRVDFIPLGRALEPNAPPPVDDLVQAMRLAEAREVKPIKVRWGNLDIDGIECRWARAGVDLAVRAAWIPSFPQSVAVCVSAPSTMAKELPAELLGFAQAFKGTTRWLTPGEGWYLRTWRYPAFLVPGLSGLFLVAWAAVFRGRPMMAHRLRLAWHFAVPAAAGLAYFFLDRSAPARAKMGIEAPVYFWVLLVIPLVLLHAGVAIHRLRQAVELGD